MATKEEKFLAALLKQEQTKGLQVLLDPRHAARAIGLGDKAVVNTINILAGTNFIVKHGDMVQLTAQGRALAERYYINQKQ